MGGIIAMAYAGMHPKRLSGLIINDIGPDVEEGNHRITRLMGYRPDTFPTLEAAMAYRRRISLALAGRDLEEQRELALGVLREDAAGCWRWKMDPAYIRQRVAHGPPARPDLWRRSSGHSLVRHLWSGGWKVTFSREPRPGAWRICFRRGPFYPSRRRPTPRPWWSPRPCPSSPAFWKTYPDSRNHDMIFKRE